MPVFTWLTAAARALGRWFGRPKPPPVDFGAREAAVMSLIVDGRLAGANYGPGAVTVWVVDPADVAYVTDALVAAGWPRVLVRQGGPS